MPATRPSTPVTKAQAPAADRKEVVPNKAVEPSAAQATHSKAKQVVNDIVPPSSGVAAVSAAAVPAQSPPNAASSWPAPAFRKRPPIGLAMLWVVTAAIPAIVVWAVMRTPNQPHSVELAKRRIAATPLPPPLEPVAKPIPAESPPQVAPTLAELAAPAPQVAVTATEPAAAQGATLPASSTSPVPSSSVVVETDSADRVSVLVKSRPTGAKVYRRGKEIGRTPLTIQIGRGEHRIFEVGWASSGSKRISVDGEKPEITVTLAGEPKPPSK